MGSKKGGTRASWSSTPEGWVLRGIIQIYYNQGHREDTIGECLRRHVPRDVYIAVIGKDVTNNAIAQRGHKGVLPKNEFEHPDKHPVGKMMWPIAQRIVSEKRTVTLDELHQLVKDAIGTKQEIQIQDLQMDETHKQEGGVLYIVGNGSKNCALGITYNIDFMRRINSFKKGDINGEMSVKYAIWLADPRRVETELKRMFADFSNRNERYSVHANHVHDMAEHFANKMQIPRYDIKIREEELV